MSYLKILKYARNVYGVPSGNEDNMALAATAMKNLEDYGFTFGEEGLKILSTASKEEITAWYYDMCKELNELAGGNHTYRPFYPNFPEEVMELSSVQRFVEQLAHYMFGYMPDGENKKAGIKSLETSQLKPLGVIDSKDRKKIKAEATAVFKNTLASKQNINESKYKNIIREYMKANALWMKETGTVTNRGVLSMLYYDALMQKKNTEALPALVSGDYLRLAKLFSHCKLNKIKDVIITDPEVYDNTKLVSLPNNVRKFIIKGLDGQKNLEEDVARNVDVFKILFKYLHVGTAENNKYSNLQDVAYKIRNNQHLDTFYSKMEKYFSDLQTQRQNISKIKAPELENEIKSYTQTYGKLLNLLGTRPGEFIKRIDRVIQAGCYMDSNAEMMAGAEAMLLKKADECFKKTRPEDLINFIEFINSRTNPNKLHIHNVRGNLILNTDKQYAVYSKEFTDKLADQAKKAIAEQIYSGKSYGKVYIAPEMDKMTLPKDTVKDNEISSYPKGSRLPVEKAEDGSSKNLRFFIWWTNNDRYAIDLDLSATLYGTRFAAKEDRGVHYIEDGTDKLNVVGSVSYHSHYNQFGATHSGDIVNGGSVNGKGVCEYIDLNFDELRKAGVKYVQMYVNGYDGVDSFKEMINCEFGWQERKELDRSEQFNIKAVKVHGKLTSNTLATTPCIIDVDKAEVIWLDVPNMNAKSHSNSLSATPIDIMMDRYANDYRISMGEMAKIAVSINGGTIVDDPKEADTVFMVDNYAEATSEQRVITSKDADVWLGEFMSPAVVEDNAQKEEPVKDLQQTPEQTLQPSEMETLKKMKDKIQSLQSEIDEFIQNHELKVEEPQASSNEDYATDEEAFDEEVSDEPETPEEFDSDDGEDWNL